MMDKVLTSVVALFILGACASYTYDRRFEAAGGGYYIAASPPSVSYYDAPYRSLYGYGITPWWGYVYHSPYFYPHEFHVWYTPWPYYTAWPYYSPWYAAHFHRYPPAGRHALAPGRGSGDHPPGAPLPDYSGTPVVLPAEVGGPWRLVVERGRAGELRYARPNSGLPASMNTARSFPARGSMEIPVGRAGPGPGVNAGITAPARSIGAPLAPAAGGRPAIGGGASPVRLSEPGPAPHHQ